MIFQKKTQVTGKQERAIAAARVPGFETDTRASASPTPPVPRVMIPF